MIASCKSSLSGNRIRNSTRRCCAVLLSGVSVTFLLGSGCPPSGVGGSCGGIDSACLPGLLCKYPEGTCPGLGEFGVCVVRPAFCPLHLDLVCGCNGQTYDNECFATKEGVSVRHQGSCDDIVVRECGGLQGLACEADEFCNFTDGSCGAADQLGICEVIPEACDDVFDPVCGCDDQTYSNECEAAAAGVSVVSQGECTQPQ